MRIQPTAPQAAPITLFAFGVSALVLKDVIRQNPFDVSGKSPAICIGKRLQRLFKRWFDPDFQRVRPGFVRCHNLLRASHLRGPMTPIGPHGGIVA
jgi:hypothetical protein